MKNQIIQGDCLEVMRGMPDKLADLIVTSPPYNVGKNNMTENKYGKGDDMTQDEYYAWTKEVLDQCLRVAHTTFYNIQMLSDNKRTVLALLGEYRNHIKDIIIWNKNSAAPAIEPGVMTSKFEFIIILSDDRPEKRKFTKGNFHGNFSNVLEGGSASSNIFSDVHKATFPEYLPLTLIERFSKEGDTILDPFGGTCTTAVACIQLKRNYICIEKEEQYVNICNERLLATTHPMF